MASGIIFNWDDGGSKAMVKRNEPFYHSGGPIFRPLLVLVSTFIKGG